METRAEVVARLAKNGGYVLLVGGGLAELGPPYTNHAQIIIWDDLKDNGLTRRTIPTNTRAILCTKWISHAMMGRLQLAASQIHATMFPYTTKKEIKECLVELLGSEEKPMIEDTIEVEMSQPEPPEVDKGYITGDEIMRKAKKGEVSEILSKEFDPQYKKMKDEVRRLLPIINKKYGIKQTEGSLEQAIYKYKAGVTDYVKKGRANKVVMETSVKSSTTTSDDFGEAEKMLQDAKAAIELLLGFIPKLRKEVEIHRRKMNKLRELIGE